MLFVHLFVYFARVMCMCIEPNWCADSQYRGKQEKHKRKMKIVFTNYPNASVNVLTTG